MENYQKNLLEEYSEVAAFLDSLDYKTSKKVYSALKKYQKILKSRIQDDGLEVVSSDSIQISTEQFKAKFKGRLKNLKNGFIDGTIVNKVPEKSKRKKLFKQLLVMESISELLENFS